MQYILKNQFGNYYYFDEKNISFTSKENASKWESRKLASSAAEKLKAFYGRKLKFEIEQI
jgi:hypothetical protein